VLEVSHAASPGGLSPFGFGRPIIFSGLSSWISTGRTGVLLNVKRTTTTTTAQDVRFVMSFTEGAGTLGHL